MIAPASASAPSFQNYSVTLVVIPNPSRSWPNMRRCVSERCPSSDVTEERDVGTEDDDFEYVTDLTDVDEDTNEGDNASDAQITDEECLQEEQDRPPEYYLTHAEEVNKSDVVRIGYADSGKLHCDGIEEQRRQ